MPNAMKPLEGINCGWCCTKIQNLSVIRGGRSIIHDINLHIHCGELTAVIGPNGAGKSTFLKALIGEVPYQGNISFLEGDGKRSGKPLVGYVPQRWEFDPGSPVSVQDLFSARHRGWPVWLFRSQKKREETLASLARVQAGHLIDRKLGELSGGEIQRVLLALAMEPIPDLLLLDEPVSGVDFNGRELFYRMVSDLRRQYDLSIIMVSHDLELMKHFADRIVFLEKTILCEGSPEQVLKDEKVLHVFGTLEKEPIVKDYYISSTQEGSAV
ncbi:metal ABC transporter ATP-binding protein [Candidatus Formimonas warabiya]|uniref:ABC transporter ATP-binding protein n=1 Tax=Formimonas warabiya TaxID=1761012 RepID=A0A3G1KYR8_FORW1|nr:metal ABC transporter ATP-binding protein [Candidatus Formimonas warabiya]ATW27653.1 ABC transporter ATP-binding protein [Candidatus Formimonas warabiya]